MFRKILTKAEQIHVTSAANLGSFIAYVLSGNTVFLICDVQVLGIYLHKNTADVIR